MKTKKIWKTILLVFLISIISIILGGMTAFFAATANTNLDPSAIQRPSAKAVLTDQDGNAISYSSSTPFYVPYSEISHNTVNAFIAMEDKRFYKHHGVDYIRTGGALIANLKSGKKKQGGSTITQQLAKNTLLSNEKTLERKLKEWKLAYQIESKFSKEEIMTMYLNAIYFGNGIYGIGRASERIFGKSPAELNLSESAMLAGIVKNPRDYSPLSHPDTAKERMKLVLSCMARAGMITKETQKTAENYNYIPIETQNVVYPYSEAVLEEAAKLLGITEKELVKNNYRITTYCDTKLQNLILTTASAKNMIPEDATLSVLQLDNETGGVVAYFSDDPSSVLLTHRQAGSVIKPLAVYTPAFNEGLLHPNSPIEDVFTDFYGYAPKNYGDNYLGWTDIENAVMQSSNVVAVKTLRTVGVDTAKSYGEKLHLEFSDEDGLPLALGGTTNGVTLTDIAAGYATLANEGNYLPPRFIKEITLDGKTLYRHTPIKNRVFSAESSYFMTEILQKTAQSGTAKRLRDLPFSVAAKTGTVGNSEGNTDAWNLSYTSDYTLAVRFSAKENKFSLTGGGHPTFFARAVWSGVGGGKPFTPPPTLSTYTLDTYSTEKTHQLTFASDFTPLNYRKNVYWSNSYPGNTDGLFQNAVPSDYRLDEEDGYGFIRFTPNPYFIYRLYENDVLIQEWKSHDTPVTWLTENYGNYRLEVVAEDDAQTLIGITATLTRKRFNFGIPFFPFSQLLTR